MNSGEFNWVPQNNFGAFVPWNLETALPPKTRKRRRNNTNMNLNTNNAANNYNTRNGMNLNNAAPPKTKKSIRFANNIAVKANGYSIKNLLKAVKNASGRGNLANMNESIKTAIHGIHSRKRMNSYPNNTPYLNDVTMNRFMNILVNNKNYWTRKNAIKKSNINRNTKNRMLEYLTNIQELEHRFAK
jgi:hypothetical protein